MTEEATMRAKFQVSMVQEHGHNGVKTGETLSMHAVAKNGYDETGLDDDNTYAKWSPGGTMVLSVANPVLWGKFAHGDKFYLDFTRAEK